MYRLILHGESHFEEQVYNMHDSANFHEFISVGEKKRTAIDILCLLYLLQPGHVIAHFSENEEVISKIEEWCNQIPLNSTLNGGNTELSVLKVNLKTTRTIPLYDFSISAGPGMDLGSEEISSTDYETDNLSCDFALRISGNSMEPDVPNDSIILIKKSEVIDDGKIGAFFYNGAAYCKKVVRKGQTLYLESLNPEHEPIEVKEDDTLRTYGELIDIISPL